MPTLQIQDFLGGLDSRRLPINTPGGALLELDNAHINRGGEIEQRKGFISAYALPAGATVSLVGAPNGLTVFGSGAAPGGMPIGVNYQQLQHPTVPATALTKVLSADLFAGKIYAAALFADGSIHHFYNGVNVADFYDGRASASFTVAAGGPAVAATGSFEITGGTVGTGNEITSVAVGGTTVTSGAVAFTTDTATTATAVASNITAYSTSYTASASGSVVTITAKTAGAAQNGLAVTPTPGGTVTVGSIANMAGGEDAGSVPGITVDGVQIIAAPVAWSTSNTYTAAAIAAAINAFVATPQYTAVSSGATVTITPANAGSSYNGYPVVPSAAGNISLSGITGLTLQGGTDAPSGSYQPGPFVKTFKTKEYTLSGSAVIFSGVGNPTGFASSNTGSGLIDLSTQAEGSEQLTSIGEYQKFVAFFAPRTIQIWYLDADPSANQLQQVLNNTGTSAPRSVTSFGDADLFYLAKPGIRSVVARDASNAAITSDPGTKIDTYLNAYLATLTPSQQAAAIGVIEPTEGRFMLFVGAKAFVFSLFQASKVSAWSTYTLPFNVDDVTVFEQQLWIRSGDTIYAYGGLSGAEYDPAATVTAQLPFLSAGRPSETKNFQGFDCSVQGTWQVAVALDPDNPTETDDLAVVKNSTFDGGLVPATGFATHASLIFTSVAPSNGTQTKPAVLGSCTLHFEDGPNL